MDIVLIIVGRGPGRDENRPAGCPNGRGAPHPDVIPVTHQSEAGILLLKKSQGDIMSFRGHTAGWMLVSLAMSVAAASLAAGPARGDDSYRLVHSFTGLAGGAQPGPVVGHQTSTAPQSRALYGMAAAGGENDSTYCRQFGGCGIVYKLSPPVAGSTQWIETRVYVFHGESDGAQPQGPLTFDASGAAYGTTEFGGAFDDGTVFKLTPPGPGQYFWDRTTLYQFAGRDDGDQPQTGVVLDPAGAVYGTAKTDGSETESGIVFKLTRPATGGGPWTKTVLHSFSENDGNPASGLVRDSSGALYGSAYGNIQSRGVVFKLAPPVAGSTSWTYSVLYRFPSVANGLFAPTSALIRDASGALYGASYAGGPAAPGIYAGANGLGAVFRLNPPGVGKTSWTLSTVRDFNGFDGALPVGISVVDTSGALYGATQSAYVATSGGYHQVGGLVFKLTPPATGTGQWDETVLHGFTSPSSHPAALLARDASGTLYDTDPFGGDHGTLFRLLP